MIGKITDLCFQEKGKHIILNILNKIGPSIDPCGTPRTIPIHPLKILSIRTHYFLLDR